VYRAAFWLLRLMPAELAHEVSFAALRAAAATPLGWLLRAATQVRSTRLPIRRMGIDFPNPIGLAAGFDKNATGPDALGCLGFGFIEIGTVTAAPQRGNPRPRVFRLMGDRALLNRMGFNNEGAHRVRDRLSRRKPLKPTIVGVNVGKTRACPPADAAHDYATTAGLLAPFAAYCAVNVSSPNTPGLRSLQAVEPLREILVSTRAALDRTTAGRRVPLLVKIAPDLADADIDGVADLALELGLDGIIAVNTTLSRARLKTDASAVAAFGAGGISGAPLRARAVEVLARLYARVGERLTLISVGGVESADDAWERIAAGASLVQLYTGLIYGGPFAIRAMLRGLDQRLLASGFARLEDAVGSGAPSHWSAATAK
jgi:dihydroorotate dehydrogenase